MTGDIIAAAAVTILLAVNVAVVLIGRRASRLRAIREAEAQTWGAAQYVNGCAACRRWMPDNQLVPDDDRPDVMWCEDWDGCKAYRAELVAEGADA